MWDLFDFDRDGKTRLYEKVVGIELLASTSQDEVTTTVDSESYDDVLDGDDSDEFDEDDEDLDDDDEDDDSF